MKSCRYFVLSLILPLVCAVAAFAGDTKVQGSIEIVPFKVEGLVVGTGVKVDEEFGRKYNTPITAPFEFIAPKEQGVRIGVVYPPDTGGEWIRLVFVAEDKKLIENLRFTSLTVPIQDNSGQPVPLEARLAMVREALTKQGVPKALKGFPKNKVLGSRNTKIKDLPAVEVAAAFEDKDNGLMFLWMVGIINPDSPNGVMAMSQIVPALSDVKQPDDLGRKGFAAKAVSTFKFIGD